MMGQENHSKQSPGGQDDGLWAMDKGVKQVETTASGVTLPSSRPSVIDGL